MDKITIRLEGLDNTSIEALDTVKDLSTALEGVLEKHRDKNRCGKLCLQIERKIKVVRFLLDRHMSPTLGFYYTHYPKITIWFL